MKKISEIEPEPEIEKISPKHRNNSIAGVITLGSEKIEDFIAE